MQEPLDLQLFFPLLGFQDPMYDEYFSSSGTACQIFNDISFLARHSRKFTFHFMGNMFFLQSDSEILSPHCDLQHLESDPFADFVLCIF